MPLFRYEVGDKTGKIMTGAMDAASEGEVRQKLVARGYKVNDVVPVAPTQQKAAPGALPVAAASSAASGIETLRWTAPPSEMAVFFRAMASYLNAGMTMNDGLVHIAQQSPNRGMRKIADRMAARVQAGGRLSDAMSEFPRAFPPNVVGVVAAGELGGFLPVVIGDVALDYELAQRASGRWFKLINIIVWSNAIGVVLVAPFLWCMYAPGVMDFHSMLAKYISWTSVHLALPMGIVIAAYHIGAAILRQPSMRPLAYRLVLRVPNFGYASKERSMASFSRILWRLQSAGILPIQAWDAASRAAENVVIAARLYEQVETIRSGKKFSEALAATGLFSSEDQRVLAAAELAGSMGDVLQRIAAYHEDAAISAVGRTRFMLIRIMFLISVISIAVIGYAMIRQIQSQFDWVDWFMKSE